MNSRFERRNQEGTSQDFPRKVLKRIFQKTKHSIVLFYKRVFSNFSKLPEYLLSGNRLPVSCNRLPVIKFDFKKFLTEFAMFQMIFKWCNRLQYIGNRLPVYLNVEIQIQL